MNRFVAVMMLIVGSAMAADHGQHQSPTSSNTSPQYADARDFVSSPEIVTSSAWDSSSFQPTYYSAPAPAPGFGVGGNFDLGFPGNGLINTVLTVVFGLVGLSILIQLINNIMELPFIKRLFEDAEARSLKIEELTDMARFAMESYHKLQELYEN